MTVSLEKSETQAAKALRDDVNENLDLRLKLRGESRSEFARAMMMTQGAISQKFSNASWRLEDIANAAIHFGTTVEGIVSHAAVLELRKELAEQAEAEAELEKRYKQAQRELEEQYARERLSLQNRNEKRTPADVRPRFLDAPVPPVGFEPTTHDLNVSSPLRGNEKSIGMQRAEPSFGPVGECGEDVEKRCECPCVALDYASRIVSFLVMRYLVMKAVEAAARKR